jgi:hypothetical protein
VTVIAQTVAVVDSALDDVGNGLEASMGMRWEAGRVVSGATGVHLVEQEKRIEHRERWRAEAAAKPHTGAVRRREHIDDLTDVARGFACGARSRAPGPAGRKGGDREARGPQGGHHLTTRETP